MRLLPILAAAVLAAAAAPHSAAAFPKTYETAFKISVTGKQTTTWTYGGANPSATMFDCEPLVTATGNGKEVVTSRTPRPVLHKAYRVGGKGGFAPQGGARMKVEIDRSAAMRYEEAATCGSAGGVREGGPYDCGRLSDSRLFELSAKDGRLEILDDMLAPPGGWYETCPIYYDEENVSPGEVGRGLEDVPLRDLFRRDLKQHIVIFRESYPFKDGEVTGRTTIRWEVTLRRVRPIKRMG